MNTRNFVLGIGFILLGACSSFEILAAADEPPPAPPPPPVVAQPAASQDVWCKQVAASVRKRAEASGFDAATLDRMTLTAYQQCLVTSR